MNQLQSNIIKNLINPEVRRVKSAVNGFVAVVYQEERKADVYYKDMDGATRLAEKIEFPKYGDGVFSESLQPGDKVELTYKNQQSGDLFISHVAKRGQSSNDFYVEKGTKLPTSIDLY
ncbi:hypothetical protein [Tetragenococcus halophilus]|uniref:hypothetical protein n=1 Tax=Tetragenococcus halophilus TaxID=51669 RepID=UPI00301011D6